MEKYNFKKEFLLERAVSVLSDESILSESQAEIIKQVKDFGIDEIYFSTDENDSYPAVFLKKVSVFDTNTLSCIAKIQHKIWNYKKVLFLYVYNDTEIRIYNCSEKPDPFDTNKADLSTIELASAQFSDKKKIEQLVNVFSSISLDSGQFWTLQEAQEYKNKIKLQRRVDKYLIQSLLETTKCLKNKGLENIEVIHKLLLRSLFLLYLEDRKATDVSLYDSIQKGATSYFNILDNVDNTYRLFGKLEEHFNGNVFSIVEGEKDIVTREHLKFIKQCFINGNDGTSQTNLFPDWRIFNFNIIQIELLSEIYENFMAEADLEQKKKTGTFYTPPSLVELILNEKLPCNKQFTEYNVKVLDPACGSGIFLVESFKRLVKRYENATEKELTDFEKLKEILLNNIYGIEINHQSIMIAAFSLYLALLDKLNPKTLWQDKKLPYLINSDLVEAQKRGKNLFCCDAIKTNQDIEDIHFDLVVGNPPFGTENKPRGITLPQSIRDYCDKEDFAKEKVLPFLHKATKFSPKGEIALVFNAKVLTNTKPTYQKFRNWLFNDCSVEKIYNFSILRKAPKDNGGQLFDSATGPICIAFYKASKENESDRIVYYAPKTYVKNNVLEGLVIDSTDVKYLPREECRKPDTKIWKIAMWGGDADLRIVKRIEQNFDTIDKFLNDNRNTWTFGTGLHAPDEKQTNFKPTKKVICLKKVDKYYTSEDVATNVDKVFRPTKESLYKTPYLLIKETQKNKEYCSSIIDFDSYHTGYSIVSEETWKLNCLCALINSSFAKYYLNLTTASWGIERERSQSNETLQLPSILSANKEDLMYLSDIVEQIRKQKQQDVFKDTTELEKQADDFILTKILNLSENERMCIQDTLDYSMDVFDKQEKSKALRPINDSKSYTIAICSLLDDFLKSQDIYVSGTIYKNTHNAPLAIIKISFGNKKNEISESPLSFYNELMTLDKKLWEAKGYGIYFRKKLNYYDGDDVYLIRPNQRRFWTQSAAMADASELILEILNMD